ncbi:hypothetical protein PIROE2DRAFT_8849 [Piromyces sp. E2]|nr:hypothetical protein PIROE2DRAFT_8849 [Piromyces sp. E2]|eukprot:OUM64377.1 hypothetical protein PIROE2DRAFT_8849 [Piromyces sp. E2]
MSIQYIMYLDKQTNFKNLVMNIKTSLESKEYNTLGQNLNDYHVSYRYLLSAKVLDQLKEFTIQPNYECLCRALAKYAKTTPQMKLLWTNILLKVNDKLNMITTMLVSKVWKELCNDKRYYHICHYEDDLMNKVDLYLKDRTKQIRKKQISHIHNNTNNKSTSTSVLCSKTSCNKMVNNYYITPNNSPEFSFQTISNNINSSNINNNQTYNKTVQSYLPLSPISQCNVITTEEIQKTSSFSNISNDISYLKKY